MSRDYDSSDSVDYPAAVAAAAYAVKSIEDKSEYDHRRTNSGGDKLLTKIKSKAEDIARRPEKLSDEASRPSSRLPDKSVPIRTATINPEPSKSVPSIKKKPTFRDTKPESEIVEKAKRAPFFKETQTFEDSKPESEIVEKAKRAPSFKKTPTFEDNKPESEVAEKVKKAPSMKRTSTVPDQSIDIRAPKTPETPVSIPAVQPTRQSSSQPGMSKAPKIKTGNGNSKADIWEEEEMEKIRKRYKKLIKEIVEWETKKKKKAKRKLEKVEAELLSNEKMKLQDELHRRRAKAVRHFNNEVGRIESIAEGAKEQADRHQKNKELKVIEKANKIRSTGKMPSTCSCF